MSVIIPHRNIADVATAATAADAAKAIMEKVGPYLDDIDVMWNSVLLATYIRPEKTKGGIIRPQDNVQEDVFQGKVGLVLKLGSHAYVDDEDDSFRGQKVNVGEWCVYKIGDAWSLNINSYPCRMIRDSGIRLRVKDPNIIL